jgi:predicted nucleic acid-binding protein
VPVIVLDASAVIALLSPIDAQHSRALAEAPDWLRADGRLMPATAYSEAIVLPTRSNRLEQWEATFAALDVTVVPTGIEAARIAAGLRASRRGLRLPDALVVATALEHEAELVSFDTGLTAHWEGITRTG